jgi:hypothetical protein
MGRKEMPGASDSCAMGGGATRRDPNAVAAAAAATEATCARHRRNATVSSASLRSPRGGAPSGASVQRFDVAVVSTAASPSSPPAQVRCRCRLRIAGCRPGFVCSAGFRARPLLVGRLSLVANRRTVVTAVICVLLSAVASRSVFSKCYRNVVSGVSEIVIMLETHSLTHVHKRVSAELVKHAPSGAPEPLICCRCTEAAPRHDIARRSRVRRARACARRRRQW